MGPGLRQGHHHPLCSQQQAPAMATCATSRHGRSRRRGGCGPVAAAASGLLLLACLSLRCPSASANSVRTVSAQRCPDNPSLHLLTALYGAWLARPLGRHFASSVADSLGPEGQGLLHFLSSESFPVAAQPLPADQSVVAHGRDAYHWTQFAEVRDVVIPCDAAVRDLLLDYPGFEEFVSKFLLALAGGGGAGGSGGGVGSLHHSHQAAAPLFIDWSEDEVADAADAADAGGGDKRLELGAYADAAERASSASSSASPTSPPSVLYADKGLAACLSASMSVLSANSVLSALCSIGRRQVARPVAYPSLDGAVLPLAGSLQPAWLFAECRWDSTIMQDVASSAVTVGAVHPYCLGSPNELAELVPGLRFLNMTCGQPGGGGDDNGSDDPAAECYLNATATLARQYGVAFVSSGPVLFQRRVIIDSVPLLTRGNPELSGGPAAMLEDRAVGVHVSGELSLRAATGPINAAGHVLADAAAPYRPTAFAFRMAGVSPLEVLAYFQTGVCDSVPACQAAWRGGMCVYLSRHDAVAMDGVYANLQRACSALLSAYMMHGRCSHARGCGEA